MSRALESPVFIVCERQSHWAPLVRRELAAEWKLLEAGSLDHCWKELAQRPGSAVLLQLTDGNWNRVVSEVLRARGRDPQALFLAAASEVARPVRARLGQAGFVYALVTRLDVAGVTRLVRRHLRQQARLRPPAEEGAWNNLPWPQY